MRQTIKNIYVHLPFCLKKCHFCAFPIHALGQHEIRSHHTSSMLDKYITSIKKQIELSTVSQSHNVLRDSTIETIYFGGGTPSLFQADQIQQLISIIKSVSKGWAQTPQITLELNPQQMDKIEQFESIGINRFSIGIQSFNPDQLKTFNRAGNLPKPNLNQTSINSPNYQTQNDSISYMQRMSEKIQRLQRLKKLTNFNVDFILDMNPSLKDQEFVMQFIRRVKPPHITMYLMEVIENTYLQRRIKNYDLSDHKSSQPKIKQFPSLQNLEFQGFLKGLDTVHDKYIRLSDRLRKQQAYSHYEVSNFAKLSSSHNNSSKIKSSNFESRHNKAYWQGNREFIGFGMGASSLLTYKNLNPYYKQFIHDLDFKTLNIKISHQKSPQMSQEMFRITNPKTITKYHQYIESLQNCSSFSQLKSLNQKQSHPFPSNFENNKPLKKLTPKFTGELHSETYPVGLIQSYIFSAIRTQKGVIFSNIHSILMSSLESNHQKQFLSSQYKPIQMMQKLNTFVSKITQLLDNQLKGLNEQNPHFQLIDCQESIQELVANDDNVNNNQKSKREIDGFENNDKKVQGFRLLPPHGYLIADQVGNRLAVLVEAIFNK